MLQKLREAGVNIGKRDHYLIAMGLTIRVSSHELLSWLV
jgi:hypothetical protein